MKWQKFIMRILQLEKQHWINMSKRKEGVQPRFIRIRGKVVTLQKKLVCHIILMVHDRIVLILIPINESNHLLIQDDGTHGLLQTEKDFMKWERNQHV